MTENTDENRRIPILRWQRRRRHSSIGTCHSCTIHNTTKAAVRRKWRRPLTTSTYALLSCYLIQQQSSNHNSHHFTNARAVTWSNGPEDKFFCGLAWDELDCATRQNCRSGRDEECEGHETHGIQCFANTDCDTKMGGAAAFVSGVLDRPKEPTMSPNVVDFESLVEGGLFVPTKSPVEAGGPTYIPTEFPIAPPPDFEGPSDDPTDHWWCGIGIDNANKKCEVHCPNSSECPLGEICYFGTTCDARTHGPTPPPTRGPTQAPTTAEPTVSREPTGFPTVSFPPTNEPTMQGPTGSPTPMPTGRPVSFIVC